MKKIIILLLIILTNTLLGTGLNALERQTNINFLSKYEVGDLGLDENGKVREEIVAVRYKLAGKILNEYIHVDISVGVFIADFSVVVMGYFAYGINAAMYAIVGILFNAVVIDKVLTGYKTRIKIYINSRKWEGINQQLTGINAGYSNYGYSDAFNKWIADCKVYK